MTELAAPVSLDDIWRWLCEVPDPEIPVISIVDLGIVRDVRWADDSDQTRAIVTVTPTYSGCPATEVIADSIRTALREHGLVDAVLETQLSPPWTTDWLTPSARKKLKAYGIAPPAMQSHQNGEHVIDISRLTRRSLATSESRPSVACPRCHSFHTQLTSQFGSTPCKALYRCLDCLEPFDYFKCH